MDIPHEEKRFVGYNVQEKSFDAEVLRKYIYGGHVAEYMQMLKEDDPDAYQIHFSQYIKLGVEPDDMEDMYKKVSLSCSSP